MRKTIYAAALAVLSAGAVYASESAINTLKTSIPPSVLENMALPAVTPVKAAVRYDDYDEYADVNKDYCPGMKVIKGVLVCTKVKDAYKLVNIKISRKYAVKELPGFVSNIGPTDLGLLPDADTNTIFYYSYKLVLEPGTEVVGYAEIIGSENSEASFRKKTTLKYNAEGKLAVAEIEDF